jgi:hypothetical protein
MPVADLACLIQKPVRAAVPIPFALPELAPDRRIDPVAMGDSDPGREGHSFRLYSARRCCRNHREDLHVGPPHRDAGMAPFFLPMNFGFRDAVGHLWRQHEDSSKIERPAHAN